MICDSQIPVGGISIHQRAIRLDPQYASAYYNRGLTYRMEGKKAEAIADLEEFITLTIDPDLIEVARQYIEELSK